MAVDATPTGVACASGRWVPGDGVPSGDSSLASSECSAGLARCRSVSGDRSPRVCSGRTGHHSPGILDRATNLDDLVIRPILKFSERGVDVRSFWPACSHPAKR